MLTGLGIILETLVYGGFLVMFMFLLAQLLPIIYLFVAQEEEDLPPIGEVSNVLKKQDGTRSFHGSKWTLRRP